jgi:hypothetical protein
MAKLDDLIEEYREQGRDEDAEELEKLRGSTLRTKAQNADKFEKENADLKAENERLKRGPKARAAFEKAGINFENLSKLERKAIEAYDGDLDDEDIESFIEENELSVDDEAPDGDEAKDEEPAAAKVAKAARRSGERKGDPTKITPEMANDWSMEQRLTFMDEHPEEYEQLLQGETVTGVKVSA